MVTHTFDKWFNNLSAHEQDEVITHILKKQLGGTVMEGLFSGPYGKLDKGMFSGPASSAGIQVCNTCGRPY